MSYASLIQIPENLRSATSLATLASLGIHGALFAVLPLLPLNDDNSASQQQTVGLVELTPAERSRLPQATTAPTTLPPFATQQSALPPLPPPPSFPVGVIPPPPSAAIAALPVPPNTQALPQRNIKPNIPQTQTFRIASLPQQNNRITLAPSTTRIAPYDESAIATAPSIIAPPPPIINTLPPPPPIANQIPPPPSTVTSPTQLLPIPQTTPSIPQPQVAPRRNSTYNSRELLPTPPTRWRQPKVTGLPNNRLQPAAPFTPQDLPPPPPLDLENTTPNPVTQPQQLARTQPQSPKINPGPLPQKLPERGKQELVAAQTKIRTSALGGNYVVPTRSRTTTTTQARIPATTSATAPATQQANKLPERGKQELLALQQQIRDRRAANASQQRESNTTNPPAKAPIAAVPSSQQRLVTALRTARSTRSANSTTPTSASSERNVQLQAWAARQAKVQRNHAQVVTKAPIYKTFNSCDRALDGVAVVGVVVNPEGKIISGPDFLSKKGTPRVERAATAYVRNYRFLKSDRSINQQFNLQYKYNTANCSQPSPQASPDTTRS